MRTRSILAVFMLVAVAALTSPLLAGPKDRNPPAVRALDLINNALGTVTDLSDQQKEETKAVLADAEAQLASLRDEAKAKGKDAAKEARKELRLKAMEIINTARRQVETSLNETQKQTFREALKAAREEAAAKRKEKADSKEKADGKQKDKGV